MESPRYIIAVIALALSLSDPVHASPPHSGSVCAGRHLLSSESPITIEAFRSQFYWADLHTWRETRAEYVERVHDAIKNAQSRRIALSQPEQLSTNEGHLLVISDEHASPADTQSATVLGYAHVGGVTFAVRKRTVSRLIATAKTRTAEILAAARPHGAHTQKSGSALFCVQDGALAMDSMPGWFDMTAVRGRIGPDERNISFLLVLDHAPRHNINAYLQSKRDLLIQSLSNVHTSPRFASLPTRSKRSLSKLELKTATGTLTAYEWTGLIPTPRSGRSVTAFLYLWPSTLNPTDKELAALDKLVKRSSPRMMPALTLSPLLGPTTNTSTTSLSSQAEESMMPYSYLVADQQTSTPLIHQRYRIMRNGTLIDEGETDGNGMTAAQNINFFDDLRLVLPPTKD